MEKRVILIVVFLMFFSLFSVSVFAEKLDIEIENSYVPGEEMNFKLVLYDNENNKIAGEISYILKDYYADIAKEGSISSGQEVSFEIPNNAIQGPWKIIANYKDIEFNRLFNIGELEKAEIKLEGDVLILRNIGNSIYNKKILIYIGEEDQTAQVFLDIGQTKQIRLTAPTGEYRVKVIEGNEEQVLEFNGVSLTGNVIGLESVMGDGFWRKYPIVGVFLLVLLIVAMVVVVLNFVSHKK